MSSDDRRISSERFAEAVTTVNVDTLTFWDEDPYQHDVGHASLHSDRLGNTQVVLTWGEVVVYGTAAVQAQIHQGNDAGMIPVVDLKGLGLSETEAKAAALSTMTAARNATVDDAALAELLLEIQPDLTLLRATGWDEDDIDDLVSVLELSDGIGAGDPIAGRNIDDAFDTWNNSETRSFVLSYDKDTYDQVDAAFTRVREHLNLDANADVVQHLLAQAAENIGD